MLRKGQIVAYIHAEGTRFKIVGKSKSLFTGVTYDLDPVSGKPSQSFSYCRDKDVLPKSDKYFDYYAFEVPLP
jgi:hypothetical protein